MEVTRLTGIALASALMFACAGRVAPGGAASTPALDEQLRETVEVLLEDIDEGGGD